MKLDPGTDLERPDTAILVWVPRESELRPEMQIGIGDRQIFPALAQQTGAAGIARRSRIDEARGHGHAYGNETGAARHRWRAAARAKRSGHAEQRRVAQKIAPADARRARRLQQGALGRASEARASSLCASRAASGRCAVGREDPRGHGLGEPRASSGPRMRSSSTGATWVRTRFRKSLESRRRCAVA